MLEKLSQFSKTEKQYIRRGIYFGLLVVLLSSVLFYAPQADYLYQKYNDPNRQYHDQWNMQSGLSLSSDVEQYEDKLLTIRYSGGSEIVQVNDDGSYLARVRPLDASDLGLGDHIFINGLSGHRDLTPVNEGEDWLVTFEEVNNVNPEGSIQSTLYQKLLNHSTMSPFTDALIEDLSVINEFTALSSDIDTNDEFNTYFRENFRSFIEPGILISSITHVYERGMSVEIDIYHNPDINKSLTITTLRPYLSYNPEIDPENLSVDRNSHFYHDELQYYYGWSDDPMSHYYENVMEFLVQQVEEN